MPTTHYTPTEIPIVSRSKLNNTGSTIPRGTAVKLVTNANDEIAVADTAATDVFYGVARADIANGAWGDVLVLGKAVILAGGTFTQGARLTVGTAGKFVAAAPGAGANQCIAGVSERDGADTFLTEAWLTGPGSVMQG